MEKLDFFATVFVVLLCLMIYVFAAEFPSFSNDVLEGVTSDSFVFALLAFSLMFDFAQKRKQKTIGKISFFLGSLIALYTFARFVFSEHVLFSSSMHVVTEKFVSQSPSNVAVFLFSIVGSSFAYLVWRLFSKERFENLFLLALMLLAWFLIGTIGFLTLLSDSFDSIWTSVFLLAVLGGMGALIFVVSSRSFRVSCCESNSEISR